MSRAPEVFVYSACGLTLASDAPVPGLCQVGPDAAVDVTIAIRGSRAQHIWTAGSRWYVSSGLDAAGRPEVLIEANDEGYRVTYCDDTTFVIDRAGHHVIVQWPHALADADAASYLTSYVLAFVLRLRGSVPLHASAVAIDGRALLFVGDSWTGKSSTAAAFSTLGYPMLSDDIVRIDATPGGLVAYPSHSRLNVWRDSAAALFTSHQWPLSSDTSVKHSLDLVDAGYAFQATPVPLEAIYVLGERSSLESPAISPLAPRLALMTLVGHTYGSAFLDRAMRAREFDVLCRLVEEVPVRELRFSDDLGALVSSCRVLAGDRRPVQNEPALLA
jgi:hypothetical protein